jgi:putative CocE/NonD family hydrolase
MFESFTVIIGVVLTVAQADAAQVVVDRDVPVKMRDGVVLRADVWRPGGDGLYPVLVMRTPYGKHRRRFDRFVKAGYIVVCQDARGRYASGGTWESFVRFHTHDAEDGYDTVEWAARLPGSTGKVGTTGGSYNALLQWRLAPLAPPSLAAMSAHSIPARYTDLEGPGTIRPGRRLQWWIFNMTPDMRKRSGRQPADDFLRIANRNTQAYLHFLPWLDLPRGVFEEETEFVHAWLKQPHTDPWKLHEGIKSITVPNLDVVGWHDHCNGDMLLYTTMAREAKSEAARKGSRIVIGPWSHAGRGRRKFGTVDFGPDAALDITALEIRWFDFWLKNKPTGVDRDAPVRIFVMGENRWRDEHHWPLPRAQKKVLFLTSNGHANTPSGDGRLADAAAETAGKDLYAYDPRDPVPSLHGKASFTHAADQRPLADRQDILVYQSEPLEERLEVTGNPVVVLHASTDAPDTDWFVRLIDVAPDGFARDVSMGLVRARYRNGLDEPQLLQPDDLVQYTIRMNATSNAFLPGHRIRLDITSSDFPNYDRNHNTAADQNADARLQAARQTVHHGGSHATRVILPIVRPKL